MSIKNQLRAAILSGGSTGASPDPSKGKTTFADNSESIIPSADGVLHVRAQGTPSEIGAWLTVFSDNGAYGVACDAPQTTPCNVLISVKKGMRMWLRAANGMKITEIWLTKSSGGGKNPVAQSLWRVVSCLRSTFDQCLSRIEKRIRACQASLVALRSEQSKHTQLHLTGGCSAHQRMLRFPLWIRKTHTKCLSLGLGLLGSRLSYESSRGRLTRFTQQALDRSTPTLARNLVLGGASHG